MHQILIQTKYFSINTLWIFFILATIAFVISAIKLSIKHGLKLQFLSNHMWKLIFWALVGARLVSILQNYQIYFYEFSANALSQLLYIWDKGLNVYGALFGAFISFYLICKKHKQDFLKWLDVLAPAIILGLAIGHLGAFFEGSNYGKETSLPWGVNFESPSIKYTVPIHPTQIYGFIYSTGIFLLSLLLTKKSLKAGFIGVSVISIYSLLKFLENFLRGDDTLLIWGVRAPQIIAAVLFILSGLFLFLRYNKRKKKSKS